VGDAVPDREPALLNRSRLFEAVGAALRRANHTGRSSALFMASVDSLGAVNTRLGIDVGDELIAAVGGLLAAALPDGDTIGRYGSNTFAIIIDGCDADALQVGATALIEAVQRASVSTGAGPMATSISVGGVALSAHARLAADAIQYGLAALELAKLGPLGSFVAHDPSLASERAEIRKEAILSSVIGAIEDNRMLLALQPVVDARSRSCAFFEGLLRLRRPDGTLVPASEFVEEAEQLGLARRVDCRALELGLALLEEHPGLKLSVNISSLTIGDKDWLGILERRSGDQRNMLSRLIVEMTETAMIHDFEEAAAFLDRLRALGCKTAIDDFGSGYTSFRHLRQLRVDMLKIDGAFISELASDAQARVLVKSMLDMAKGLGLESVAEWVRDEETAGFLEAAGATYLQGFLYGLPMSADELVRKGML
jgi:diguanylate cyclase (GGDEF)-like protein